MLLVTWYEGKWTTDIATVAEFIKSVPRETIILNGAHLRVVRLGFVALGWAIGHLSDIECGAIPLLAFERPLGREISHG